MMVFSVGLLALASVVPLLKSDVTRSNQRTRAVFLAEETAEWLHGLAYDDSLLVAGDHDDPQFGESGYTRSWFVEENAVVSQVKRVTVSVDRDGQPGESATMVFLHAAVGR